MPTDPPVAGEKSEGNPRGRIFGSGLAEKLLQQDQPEEDQKIQRPYAQNAPHIEGLELDPASLVVLSEEQLRDEEGTEQKEDGDAQVAEETDFIEPIVLRGIDRNVVHSMHDEDHRESDETEYNQFRAIVAVDGHVA